MMGVFFVFFTLSGCTHDASVVSDKRGFPRKEEVSWISLAPGAFLGRYPVYRDEILQEVVTVLKFSEQSYALHLSSDTKNPKKISEWQSGLGAFATLNAAYFDERFVPTGYFRDAAEEYGTWYEKGENGYTALLASNGKNIRLHYLPEEHYEFATDDHRMQTYPMLILPGGRAGMSEDSGMISRRSAIGRDREGNILFMVAPRNYFTLYQFMEFLLRSDLKLERAANLDGGPSAGIAISGHPKYTLESDRIPAVIAIFPR